MLESQLYSDRMLPDRVWRKKVVQLETKKYFSVKKSNYANFLYREKCFYLVTSVFKKSQNHNLCLLFRTVSRVPSYKHLPVSTPLRPGCRVRCSDAEGTSKRPRSHRTGHVRPGGAGSCHSAVHSGHEARTRAYGHSVHFRPGPCSPVLFLYSENC